MASSIEKKNLKMLETLILNQSKDESLNVHHVEKKENLPIQDLGLKDAEHHIVDVPVKSDTLGKSNVDDGVVVSSLIEEGESSKQYEGYDI